MEVIRNIEHKLIEWKESAHRKPLILRGARQVGKTFSLKRFGEKNFEQTAYFNFDEQVDLKQFFRDTKDVHRILKNLSLVFGRQIMPQSTLVVFDEIQECNEALGTLKYFYENAPEYAVVSAGSLLGVAMAKGRTFPVGKIDFLNIYPITFSEFLFSSAPQLFDYLENKQSTEPIPDIFYSQLLEEFKSYFITGGMPEAIVAYLEDSDIERVQKTLKNVLDAYSLDFSKHIEKSDILKVGYVWNSIPSQLSRENKKFLYQTVKNGARAREYENAIEWLDRAGLVQKIHRASAAKLPLSAYKDLSSFKMYMLDTGLLRRHALLSPLAITEGNRLFTEFKGALSENYILQSLIQQFEGKPAYWTSGNKAEIDFLIQYNNDLIPVEVKSGESVRGRSLSVYSGLYHPKLRIRFSMRNLKYDSGLLNLPLFLADYTQRFINQMFH
ncbi:MAG: ATP-binding protein [Bacteroidota bacterium]|nr:ATP-binding protein [Bacteroidota bacterium]